MRKRLALQTTRPPRLQALPRRARWAMRAVSLLPLLIFLIVAARYCVGLGRLLLANLPAVLGAEITRQTGHETRLALVRLPHPGVVTITNVVVSSRDTFAHSHGEAMARVPRVTIHYALHSLLFDSGNAGHALGDIVVDHPQALVERFAPSRFNFTDILTNLQKKPSQPPSKPFDGQVIVHDATLRFRDFTAPAGLGVRPAFNQLNHVAATVNLHSERFAYFTASGQGMGRRLAAVAVQGDASRTTAGRFRVAAQVSDADAAYWTTYFPYTATPLALVRAGRADVNISVSRMGSKPPPGLPVDVLGRVAVRGAAVSLTAPQFRHLSVRGLTGGVTFTGAGVAFQAAAVLGGQPVAATGTVFDFTRPRLAVTATSAHLDPARLAAAFPVICWPVGLRVAPGPVTVNAVGPLRTPTVSAEAALPAAQYAGNRLNNLHASVLFTGGTLTVPTLTATTAGGGQVSVRGSVVTGTAPAIRFAGQARGVNLAALRLPRGDLRKLGLGGRADAQVLADNIGHPLQVVANVAVAHPRVARTTLMEARARLAFTAGRGLTVSRALVRGKEGAALISGTAPAGGKDGAWDLNVAAAGLNLAALAGPYTRAPVGGLAYFRGRIQGTAATPQAIGQVQLINPRFQRFTADVVSGGLTASAVGVRLNDMVLRRFPTAAHVSGTVTKLASADPQMDLGVSLSQADVHDFLSMAGQFGSPSQALAKRLASLPPVTGTAQGTFRIGGSVHSPRIGGRVQIADGTMGPYRVDSLSVRAAYGNGTVRVDDATLRGEGATVSAHGTAALKTGRVAAAFAGQGIDLERFRGVSDAYADLDGLFAVSGTVGGTLKSPSLAAAVAGRDVSVNGQALAPFTLAGRYADGQFVQTGAPWTLDFLPTPLTPHDIRYVLSGLRLTVPTPAHPKRAPTLALDVAVPADAPEQVGHLIETLRGSRYAATPAGKNLLARVDALPRPIAGAIVIPRLSVRGPLAAPSVQAEVRATGLALGDSRLDGLDVRASFADPQNPSAQLAATANGLLVGGVTISDVTANASLTDHVLTVDTLRATSERAFLEASGRADLRRDAAGDLIGDLNANLDASNIPLALLDPLVPQPAAVERRTLTGELGSLSVTASGPTQAPNLTASITLANPGLAVGLPGKPPSATYSLERIRSGAITLATPEPGGAQVLTVTDLAAFQAGRPIASLSGTLPFRWGDAAGGLPVGQTLHAALAVQDLSLLAPFVPTLDPKKTAGTLTAGLDVTGAGNTSLLAGNVDLTGGALGLTGFDTALTKLNAHIRLADARLVNGPDGTALAGHVAVDHFTGASSKGGTFALTGGGALGSAGAADLHLASKNLVLDETSSKNLLAKAYGTGFRGKINGTVGMVGPWLAPTLSTPAGAPLQLTDAVGMIPSGSPETGTPAGPPTFDPRFDLSVLLGGGGKTVTVSNALLRADGDGEVSLTGRLSDPHLLGHLTIARGQFILPPATRLKFVQSGGGNTVSLRYPAPDVRTGQPALRTYVDMTAQTTTSVSQAQLAAFRPGITTGVGAGEAPATSTVAGPVAFNQPQRYTITAHIHGVLNDPDLQIDLESSPPGLTRQEMLVALTGVSSLPGLFGSDAQAALQAELTAAITSVGLPILLTPLEESLASTLGFSDLDVAYAPDAPLLVTLSKQIAPRLEVTYIRSIGTRTNSVSAIGQSPQYTVKLGYALTRRLQVSVSTDDQNNNTVALEGVFGF